MSETSPSTTEPLKLTIELVPSTCWYSNVRSNVTKEQWDLIRKKCYQAAEYKCEICGGKGKNHPVECHEIWDYEHRSVNLWVQKLTGFIALCPTCHRVKHIGRVTVVEKHKFHEVFNHFARVNNLNLDQASFELTRAFAEWQERSKRQWVLDISFMTLFLKENGHSSSPTT